MQGTHGYEGMPPIASNVLDEQAVQLLSSWISITPPSESTFEDWQISLFGSTDSSDASAVADPDHDGNTNLLEFMTFTNPLDPNEFWSPVFTQESGRTCVEFTMPPSRAYEVQISDDLQTWQTWNVPGNPPESDSVEEIQAKIQGPVLSGDNSSFLRVQVTSD